MTDTRFDAFDLRRAVDDLTQPIRERVTQDLYQTVIGEDGRPQVDDDGNPVREVRGKQTVTAEQPPLLVQLEEAIASTVGGGSGRTMTAAHELDVLDSDALYQFSIIRSQIGDWCTKVGVRPTGDVVHNLRAWSVKRQEDARTDHAFYVNKLAEWAGLIRGKLTPSATLELVAPCPICEGVSYEDDDGNVGPFPVKITYRKDSTDILRTATATCRACGHEWRGSSALRYLRWEVDAREHAATTDA